jgi:large conductance mechanosensitive channel
MAIKTNQNQKNAGLAWDIRSRINQGVDRTGDLVGDFKSFAIKGSVVDLAVGIVIGAAFTSIVNSLVNDVINPIILTLTGRVEFTDLFIALSGKSFDTIAEAEEAGVSVIKYGSFIDATINFLIVALALFIIIRIVIGQQKKEVKKVKAAMKKCVECFEEIKEPALRCMYCTAKQPLPKAK